jgi:uncharacterized protein (TIGR00266 family)
LEHRILGTTAPVLEIRLQPGEQVLAESGEVAWISMAVQLQSANAMGVQQGGFLAALGRGPSEARIFMTEYTAVGGVGIVAFSAKLPGQIMPLEVTPDRGYLVHRHGLMCSTRGVGVGVGFQQRLGGGVFRGPGFRMQRVTGQGQAFVEIHGEAVHYDLQPGNTLRIHPGHVAMFEDSVDFNVTTMPGIRNTLFGGDGLFLAALTGPGRVWLQSMSLPHLAHAISGYVSQAAQPAPVAGLLEGP